MSLGNLSRVTIAKRLRPKVVAYAMTDVLEVDETPAMSDNETERMRRSVWVEVAIAAVRLSASRPSSSRSHGANEAIATRNRDAVTRRPTSAAGRPRKSRSTRHARTSRGRSNTHRRETDKPHRVCQRAGQAARPDPGPLVANGAGQYTASEVDLPVKGKLGDPTRRPDEQVRRRHGRRQAGAALMRVQLPAVVGATLVAVVGTAGLIRERSP